MRDETRHSVVTEAAPFLSQAGRASWRKPLAGAVGALLLLAWHEATGAFACFSNAGDEWMEVNKVIAVARGHRLYREIWNDQPPLYTVALSGLADGEDTSMEWYRRATFVFAGTLLVAVCGVGAVLGLSLGELACAAGFLIASPLFLPSSASTTLEIPALSLGVMGAWLLLVAVGRRSWLLAALGGCVLGVAAMTKLTALSIVPVVGGLAAVGLLSFGGRQSWQVLGVALLAFVATTAAAWHVCSDGAPWRHLLGTHFSAYPLLDAEARAAYRFRWDWFSWQPLFSLAAVGGLLCLARSPRRWTAVVLGLWVAAVALVFAVHFPWWNYYSLHLCVPLALLAGVGLWQTIRWSVAARAGAWLQTGGRLLAAAFAVACVWGWGEAFAAEMRRVRTVGRWQDNPIVRCVREQISMDRSHALIMLQLVPGPYAMYCGLKPLPWYAVLPKKTILGWRTRQRGTGGANPGTNGAGAVRLDARPLSDGPGRGDRGTLPADLRERGGDGVGAANKISTGCVFALTGFCSSRYSGSRKRPHPGGAFTLVEMLVVLAVIALLLSLLLPTLVRSKMQARKTQCLSNLRQVALAIELYAADHEQRFPWNYDGLAGRELVPNWAYGNMADPADRRDTDSLADPTRTLLAPHLKDPRLFKCPADRTDAVRSLSLNCRVNPVRLNAEPRWLWGAGTNHPIFRRTHDLMAPSRTFTVLDEEEAMINDGYFAVDLSNTGDPYGLGTPVPLTIIDFPARRHTRGATVAFGDGHVELVRWRDALLGAETRYPGLRVHPASFDGLWLHEHTVGYRVSPP